MKILYIDEFLLLEGIADGLLLWAAGKLCCACRKRLRILFGAMFGAGYTALSVFWKPASCIGMKIVSLAGMLIIAYGGEKRLWRIGLSFLAMSAIFAGVTEAVCIAAGRTTARALLFALGTSMGLCALPFRFSGKRGGICKIRLCRGEAEVHLQALCDTGHHLREPVSGESVILAGEKELLPLLSNKEQTLLYSTNGKSAEERLPLLRHGFRLIPCHSVSGVALLLGFRVTLNREGEEQEENCWAAMCENPVHTENGCNALLESR